MVLACLSPPIKTSAFVLESEITITPIFWQLLVENKCQSQTSDALLLFKQKSAKTNAAISPTIKPQLVMLIESVSK